MQKIYIKKLKVSKTKFIEFGPNNKKINLTICRYQ